MKKNRKNPFLLLELLVAMFLISICLTPLIGFPPRVLRKASYRAWAIEAYRLADLAFAEFKGQLYAHQVPWETIARSCNERVLWKKGHKVVTELPFSLKSKFSQQEDFSASSRIDRDGVEYCVVTYRVAIRFQGKVKIFREKKREKNREFFFFKVFLKRVDK